MRRTAEGALRHEGGLCAAVFRLRLLRRRRQSKHYAFHFDGKDISTIEELTAVWNGD